MAILTVGPNSTYSSIANAMAAAGPTDTILLESGYSNETATISYNGMIVSGDATSLGIVLQLGTGIATFSLEGTAPIVVLDALDGNGIVGNSGDNTITVSGGADAVNGGLGEDRLIVNYLLATGAVTGDSTSNFTEAGGGGRLVTITDGTFENFTILTGGGADTLTVGDGDNIVRSGNGANTITAGQGANLIVGGADADTITALDGGNFIDGGAGTNTITSGGGDDTVFSGVGADTIVVGGGADLITVRGGADSVDAGAGVDRLIIDYSALLTSVTGGVTSGNLNAGYTGSIGDVGPNSVNFVATENFSITTGLGNDDITTGDGIDVLVGGAGADTLQSGGGSDKLNGGIGADLMNGGGGNDTYTIDNSSDVIVEANAGGIDVANTSVNYSLRAGVSLETLRASDVAATTALTLEGNELANALQGNEGANRLNGGGGADRMYGYGGNDTYFVDDANDMVYETAGHGIDVVNAYTSYGLRAGVSVETLRTIDVTATTAINLVGNELDNAIQGNAGSNKLVGGGGTDALYGYGGKDHFIFNWELGPTNIDKVVDFNTVDDQIWLDDAVFTTIGSLGALSDAAFFLGSQAHDASDRIIYNQATGVLSYDADGTGSELAQDFALFGAGVQLALSDFEII